MSRQAQITLMAALCILISISLGIELYMTRPVALNGFSFADDETRVLRTLNTKDTNADTVPPDFEQEIVKLTGSKGASVNVVVKAALFTPDQINDSDSWHHYLHDGDYLLVNPVDEEQHKETDDTALGRYIASGCDLSDWVGDGLKLGQVTFHDCNGKYSIRYGIGSVANAASVIWSAPPDYPQPCETKSNYNQRANCTAGVVDGILKTLFEQTATPFFTKHTWVLPSLGTGHGHLSQDRFYELASRNLAYALENRPAQPITLILLVKSGDPCWQETKKSIAHHFATITRNSRRQIPPSEVLDRIYFAGALLGIAAWLFAFQSRLGFPSLAMSVPQSAAQPFAVVLSLIAASWGLCASIKQGLAFTSLRLPSWMYFTTGIVAVFVCLPILRSMNVLKTLTDNTELPSKS